MTTVRFDNATRVFPGSERPAVDKLNLDIADGEFLVLVGPSGCGKSTSLRMLAGLEDVDGGAIWIGDRDITDVPPKDRDVAMVFQNYALYPHMSVADNMGFALKIAGVAKDEIRSRVLDAAKILDLEAFLDRKPKALSGGQRQRVAMGRAIVRSPQVFLMDEPLSNLDAKLRVQTRSQIAALQRRLGVTTVYVTHDQVEAMTMGDRVAVLKDGILQQVDTPSQMYDKPANVFVAGFIGSPAMNLLDVGVQGDTMKFGNADLPLRREAAGEAHRAGDAITVGVRPEDMELVGQGQGLPTVINLVESLGADAYVYGEAKLGDKQHHIMWLGVHLFYITGFKNQVTALLHWTVTFIGNDRSERTATEQQIFARQALERLDHGANALVSAPTPVPTREELEAQALEEARLTDSGARGRAEIS